MFGTFDVESKYHIEIHPKNDRTSGGIVTVRVLEEWQEETSLPIMAWGKAFQALATRLQVNEHQLDALSWRPEQGRTLRLCVVCRRSDLVATGFLPS
jgi:hypothetical protein